MTFGRSCGGVDAHPLSGFSDPFKLDKTVRQGEQRIVTTDTDIGARVHFCAALPDNNAPRKHLLTSKALDAQSLRIAVAPVS